MCYTQQRIDGKDAEGLSSAIPWTPNLGEVHSYPLESRLRSLCRIPRPPIRDSRCLSRELIWDRTGCVPNKAVTRFLDD